MKQYDHQAIRNVHAEASIIKYSHEGKIYKIYDVDNNIISIDEDKVSKEHDRLIAEYDAQEYARNRQAEYPDMGSQLNKIYDDGVTKWKSDMVDPVKAKWPKDNSGPK